MTILRQKCFFLPSLLFIPETNLVCLNWDNQTKYSINAQNTNSWNGRFLVYLFAFLDNLIKHLHCFFFFNFDKYLVLFGAVQFCGQVLSPLTIKWLVNGFSSG